MTALVWIANIVGWPLIHIVVAHFILRMPAEGFAQDTALYRTRAWESGGQFYRRWLRVHRWKSLLPDGAPWLRGISKRSLARRDPHALQAFLLETRRGELAHWIMLACLPVFFLWNPPWACAVMAAYAVLANVPCIVVQRYNRQVLLRVLARFDQRVLQFATP